MAPEGYLSGWPRVVNECLDRIGTRRPSAGDGARLRARDVADLRRVPDRWGSRSGRRVWRRYEYEPLVIIISALGSLALAQRGPAAGQTFEKIRQLTPNLYMVTGGGANTLVRVTPDGLIVVDTKNPGEENYRRLMEEIASVSPLPVKYVFNTHHHPDHVGNNQRFIDAGAQVVALEALKTRMASDPRTKDIPGLPTLTFPKDYGLKFGGADVKAYSFGRGHTGDDTMVYFPDSKVVMVSDQITSATPIVDFANGGSAVEWTQILDGVLKLDFEVAIPAAANRDTRRSSGVPDDVRDASSAGRPTPSRRARRKRRSRPSEDRRPGLAIRAGIYASLFDELSKKP